MILQITCHVFIADAPERASILNMNKFNGKYGCFMCIQQGENLVSNERGNNFKNTFKPNEMFIRTEHKYAQQVQESIRKNEIFEGIKGSTYLSKIKTTTM